ncbi:MAG TPA: c(7)-type cytochrome triheme domain-containing protein [Dissulfurispiraceae bacterium]|nr:c(7)-type cytochrome triheme domain-containing protein [Dissulfurispiraceae bacterium]
MKIAVLAVMVVAMVALIGTSWAVPPGKTVEFAGEKSPGKVVFDGKIHADKGLKCKDCHAKLFKMKKGVAKITQADHKKSKLCFACHNGKKAFAAANNCTKCHKK